MLYGTQNVDEKYSKAIEPNLFSSTVLIPGVTYTDKYQIGPGGAIYVHKIDSGNSVEPGVPGRDFSDEAAKDALIPILLNNNYQKSRKIYGVQAAAVEFAMAEEYLADTLNVTKEGRQYSGIACMANEGTASADTSAITETNVVAQLIALRKAVKDNKGKANFALVSTAVYANLLKNVGFAESYDSAIATAELLKRFGLTIMECNSFDTNSAKYYDKTGTLKTVDLTGIDIIIGNFEATSIIDNMEMYRLIDSENFNGSKAQVEYNTGFTVTSPDQVIVKKTVIEEEDDDAV